MATKQVLLFVLLANIFFCLQAQDIEVLHKTAKKTESAKNWNELAEALYHRRTDPGLLKIATDNAIRRAKADGDSVEWGRARLYASDLLFQNGDLPAYFEVNRQMATLFERFNAYHHLEEALNNIATYYGEQDKIDSLKYYTSKAIALNLTHNGDLRQLGNEYQNMAYAYSVTGVIDSSLYYINCTIDALVLAKDTLRLLDAYNQMGVVYVKKKDYPSALNCFNDALHLYDLVENKHNRLYIYTNLAAMYQKWGKLDKAIEFSRKAVYDAADTHELLTYGKLLCNLGGHLYRSRCYQQSIDTLMQALPHVRSSHHYLGMSYQALAANYLGLHEMDSCNRYMSLADSLATSNQFVRGELFYASKIGILMQQNKYEEALPFARRFMELDVQKGLKDADPVIYNLVSETFKKSGDYVHALEYKSAAYALQDSINKKETAAKLNEFYTLYKTAEKDMEIAQLHEQKAYWAVAMIVMAVLILSLLFLYRLQRLKKEKDALALKHSFAQKELEYQQLLDESRQKMVEQYVLGLEAERTRLAKELHDGIANDVLAICMGMEGEKTIAEEAKERLRVVYENIRMVSHDLTSPVLKELTFADVLQDFVRKHNHASGVEIILNLSAKLPWASLSENIAINSYRIIQEAIGNAIKHGRATQVVVQATLDEGLFMVEVRDNGNGFDQRKKHKGIGLRDMQERATAIGADLAVQSEDGKGVIISFNIPFSFSHPSSEESH